MSLKRHLVFACTALLLISQQVFAAPVTNAELTEELSLLVAKEGKYEAVELNLIRLQIPNYNTASVHDMQSLAGFIPDSRTIEIRSVKVDSKNAKFTAELEILPNTEKQLNAIKSVVVTGKIDPLINVPVLVETGIRDKIIEERDLVMKTFPERMVRDQNISRKEEVIGKKLMRRVNEGQLISFRDIDAPTRIKKGQIVEMWYETPTMQLKTTGKAESDGKVGDLIPIKNTDSGKVIYALVRPEGKLLVNYASLRLDLAEKERQ